MRVIRKVCAALFAVALVLLGSQAHANMQVTPLIIELGKTPGQSGAFSVRNTSTNEIPVSISVVRREVGTDEPVELIPADADFIIFPPQTVIGPQAIQSFRFQYVGDDTANVSSSYYIYASQLPVEFDEDKEFTGSFRARLNFLYEYGVSVNLIPDGAAPALVVTNAARATMDDGKPAVELTIENQGNRFGRASEHELTIVTGSGTSEFNAGQLRAGLNNGMWLPGQSFEIKFPVEKRATGNISATFDYLGN